jgi:hypothetical protein
VTIQPKPTDPPHARPSNPHSANGTTALIRSRGFLP